MSNPNNGKLIEGTEGFKPPMYLPTGSSNGGQQSALYNDILKRIALHRHNGDDSLAVSLPDSASEIFPTVDYNFVPDTPTRPDLYRITLSLENIQPYKSNLEFYYTTLSGDDNDDWVRFYPEYVVSNNSDLNEITIFGLLRSDIKIKVSA